MDTLVSSSFALEKKHTLPLQFLNKWILCIYMDFPLGLSLQVMCCCCNKLCLTLWSQLLWKPTGPLSCSTHLGEYWHTCTATFIFNKKMGFLHDYSILLLEILTLPLSICSTSLFSVSFSLSLSLFQYGWGSRDSILGDPFRPVEIPEIHWYWEKNCQVSRKTTVMLYIIYHHIELVKPKSRGSKLGLNNVLFDGEW